MPTDMELVKKGLTVTRSGLLDQTAYQIELEAKYRGALNAAGWTATDSAELVDQFASLKTQMAETIEARADSKMDRQNEQSAINEAKAYKRKLILGFANLLAEGRVSTADYDAIYKTGPLGRVPRKILQYFANTRGLVSKYDAELSPYFGGTSAVSLFDAVHIQLERAQSVQELNLKALPQETLKIYEMMGRLLVLIEKMNRVGKIAFDGQARIIAEFNKDLLLRSRSPRTKSTVEPVGNVGMNEDTACKTEGEVG